VCVVGHFGEWQLIFYGTQSAPISFSVSDTANSRTKPTAVTGATTTGSSTSPDHISSSSSSSSSSSLSTVADHIWSNNGTFLAANVSTASDAGVTSPWQPALMMTNTTPSSNLSVVKDLSVKDSDAENSTELKSGGVLNNGTFVTLPPAAAAVPGHVTEEENQTNAYYSGYPTTASNGARVSPGFGFVYELLGNVTTGSEGAYENVSTPNVTGSDVTDDVTTSALAAETEAYNGSSVGLHTTTPTALESPMPVLLHGQVGYCSSEVIIDQLSLVDPFTYDSTR